MIRAIIIAFMLTGCAYNSLQPTTSNTGDARKALNTIEGTVIKVYATTLEGNREAGQAIGAVIGGMVADNATDNKGNTTNDIATTVGALVGSKVGDNVGNRLTQRQGVELIIKLDNGRTVSVSQEEDEKMSFQEGDRVFVIGWPNYSNLRVLVQ